MKRWICLFLSLAVCVSVLSLGVHAVEPDLDIQDLYVYSSIVLSTSPGFEQEISVDGQITDRSISNPSQRFTRIKNFSFTCPGGSWFLIDFDIIAEDNSNTGTSLFPSVTASRDITSYILSDFSVSGSVSNPTIYRAEVRNYSNSGGFGNFVHYSIFGLNTAASTNNIVITYNSPITLTADLIAPSHVFFTQRITNVNCKVSDNMEQFYLWLSSMQTTLDNTYFEIVSIGDTLGNFYNEFHSYWRLMYIAQNGLFNGLLVNNYTYSTLTYSNNIGSWQSRTTPFINRTHVFMGTIERYLQHQINLENKATESGANDAYDDLNDSASFGSLTDFAGAGSSASWSAGSFVNGLGETWNWFTQENKQMIDAVQPSRNEVYISIYDDTLEEYYNLLGGE